jgi:hypothetical protein
MSAVGAVGAGIIGTGIMWPIMKRYLRKYDEAHLNIEAGGKFKEVEEDR